MVMDKHLWVITKQEGIRIDGSRFLRLDSRVAQEWGLVLGHTVIRQSGFWCSSEEGLSTVMGCCEYKTLIQS